MSFASVDFGCRRSEQLGSLPSDASSLFDDPERRAVAAREFAELAFSVLALRRPHKSLAGSAESSPPVGVVPLKSRAKHLVKVLKRKSRNASQASGASTGCSSCGVSWSSPCGSPA